LKPHREEHSKLRRGEQTEEAEAYDGTKYKVQNELRGRQDCGSKRGCRHVPESPAGLVERFDAEILRPLRAGSGWQRKKAKRAKSPAWSSDFEV
jgi:hypothetical protein